MLRMLKQLRMDEKKLGEITITIAVDV